VTPIRLCITGTDTDVGKSLVTACLAAAWRATGRSVLAAKPIASGVPAGAHGEDAERIAAAAGHPPLTWARFAAPISPHRAQRLEGRDADPAALLAWLDALDADVVLVEAAGGWRVPLIADGHGGFVEAADLARRLGGAVLVVAADRLGVLSHTRLTVQAIQDRGLPVAGVALDAVSPQTDESSAFNLEDLRSLLDVPVAAVPFMPRIDPTILAATGSRLIHDLGL
jgi:dethiobiotin synthetase